jgi:hypothetical protein
MNQKNKKILTFVLVLAVAIITIAVISSLSDEFEWLSSGWSKYSHDRCAREVDLKLSNRTDVVAFIREDMIKECQDKIRQTEFNK